MGRCALVHFAQGRRTAVEPLLFPCCVTFLAMTWATLGSHRPCPLLFQALFFGAGARLATLVLIWRPVSSNCTECGLYFVAFVLLVCLCFASLCRDGDLDDEKPRWRPGVIGPGCLCRTPGDPPVPGPSSVRTTHATRAVREIFVLFLSALFPPPPPPARRPATHYPCAGPLA